MAKKRVQKIPKFIVLKCPMCIGKSKARASIESSPGSFVCPKCEQDIKCPITQCCIICAFSNKKCPRSLYMEARAKGLELR